MNLSQNFNEIYELSTYSHQGVRDVMRENKLTKDNELLLTVDLIFIIILARNKIQKF